MHIGRKPGETMEVDWAGQTARIVDTDTGADIEAYVFLAAMPYSGYAYAEAFPSQNQEAWISAHVNAYGYFGGVTRILVPDNLKTGVVKSGRTETVLNRTYQEMAEHYGTAILPARVRAPKDKATVEGSVGNLSTFILAAIRDQRFFSLRELNAVIREKLHAFNHKPFQKMAAVPPCSQRREAFCSRCPGARLSCLSGRSRRRSTITTFAWTASSTPSPTSTSSTGWTCG